MLVWQHWLALVLGVILFLAWSALSLPTTFAVITTSLDKRQHTMDVGVQSMVRRVPMMVGPLIGGWLITCFGWEQGIRCALSGCSGVTAQQFGVLTAAEMATAMLCYIPVAHLADKHGQRPFVFATFIFFTLFPVSLMFAHGFGRLVVAFVVRGLKEFGEPARKALIIAQASPELRARTYGAYYLIRDCVVTTGSFLGACYDLEVARQSLKSGFA